ncbi:MAG: diguanylate cyclase [Bdellovibrionales bacterium]|nr:diguanylate cyclase [Bdellovibrionales bacterium]
MTLQAENQQRKILVVDDDEESRKIVSRALEFEGYQVETASSGDEAISNMNTWKPHLVLLDVSMPGLNGIETLKLLRAQDEYVSCIFVSGKSNPEDVIRGLDTGADDYVRKPFDVLELLARVRSQLRIKDLNDRLQKANVKLKELVDIDDLTGLFNMRSLYKKLDFELERAQRYGRQVCVLMMDMDHFKNVNDSNDHLFGSYVLSEVGRIIKDNVRKVDFAARYGGDEFLIVLTEIELNGAKAFAERLRVKIENTVFKNESYSIRLTASIGFAMASPKQAAVDGRTLVRLADQQLYKAKEGGRNRYEYLVCTADVLGVSTSPEMFRKS